MPKPDRFDYPLVLESAGVLGTELLMITMHCYFYGVAMCKYYCLIN